MQAPDAQTFVELATRRFRLRRIVAEDVGVVFRGLSDPLVIAHYGVSYESLDATRRQMDWFEEIRTAGTGVWWGICRREPDSALIGACGLNDVNAGHRRAEIGYWLLPEFWGRGVMVECLEAMLRHAFDAMGLHRVAADVDVDNHRSRRLLERLGFQLEGVRRGCELKGGVYLDLMCYSRLATDSGATPGALQDRSPSLPAATVRRANLGDIERVAPLFDAYRQFYGLEPSLALARQFMESRLLRAESVVLLAEAPDGGVLGFVQMYPSYSSLRAARICVLYDLFVVPGARRLGVGRSLMHAAAAEARRMGAVAMVLSTAKTNLGAQRLYESLGWQRDEHFDEYGLSL
jgi:[ribosomal protein S5]-alanine N-acetyltransferase